MKSASKITLRLVVVMRHACGRKVSAGRPRLEGKNMSYASRRDLLQVQCLTGDRKSTRLNSSHQIISYAVFCLKKKKNTHVDNATDDNLSQQIHTKDMSNS